MADNLSSHEKRWADEAQKNRARYAHKRQVLELVQKLIESGKAVFQPTKTPYLYVARHDRITLTFTRSGGSDRYALGIEMPGLQLWVRSHEDTSTYKLFWAILEAIRTHENEVLAQAALKELKEHFDG